MRRRTGSPEPPDRLVPALERERYESAGLVLWLVGALNLLSGILALVGAALDGGGLALPVGIVLVGTAVLFGGLGLAVRRGSQAAVIVAVIVLGLVLALRAAPLLTGEVGLGNIVGVIVTGFVLVIVGRALKT